MCQKQYTSLHQQSANTTFKLTNMKCCFQQTAEFQHLPFRCRHEQLKVFYAFSISLQSLHHEYHVNITLDLYPLSPDYCPENVLP